jgi:hypothetical protein
MRVCISARRRCLSYAMATNRCIGRCPGVRVLGAADTGEGGQDRAHGVPSGNRADPLAPISDSGRMGSR